MCSPPGRCTWPTGPPVSNRAATVPTAELGQVFDRGAAVLAAELADQGR
jgi:hypothetical protein